MLSEAAPEDGSQIEMLELVVLLGREAEPEEALRNIQVITNAAAHRLSRQDGNAVNLVLRVQRREIDTDLIALGGTRRVHAKVERRGIGIAPRQAESRLDEPAPEVQKARIRETLDACLVGLLLLFGTYRLHLCFSSGDCPGIGRLHLDRAVRGRNRTPQALAALQRQVQRRR